MKSASALALLGFPQSINQIAKRCNENKSVHANDVEQLRREFLELKADYLERVVKLLRKIY